jgi:hypothetical protein
MLPSMQFVAAKDRHKVNETFWLVHHIPWATTGWQILTGFLWVTIGRLLVSSLIACNLIITVCENFHHSFICGSTPHSQTCGNSIFIQVCAPIG